MSQFVEDPYFNDDAQAVRYYNDSGSGILYFTADLNPAVADNRRINFGGGQSQLRVVAGTKLSIKRTKQS